MRLVRPLVAAWLAVLWLPLTVHCGLEAAGWLEFATEGAAECESCGGGSEPCTHDPCALVEDGDYLPPGGLAKLVQPVALHSNAVPPELASALLQPVPAVEPVESPPDEARAWTRAWNFRRRAAGAPRAPAGFA